MIKLNIVLLLTNILIASLGQIFLKMGSLKISTIKLHSILNNLPLMFGIFLYGLSFILWIIILKRLPLSIAYPSLSLGYVLITIFSAKLFNEAITYNKLAGISFIILGVWLLFK